ncbi:hypothetical protein JG688_00008441 [Phytophthora aleatoria]|uniref:RxLR effector protein n=1 Tax=Phytophthora aleatoria TaxID=2496075 RepID=A0A8J5MG65_9STRA|nr:hypothetical protein JG688_00008441 [Phytophthora aleatoria]
MRLTYIVMAAASILSAHHDTLTASAANDVALTGVMSLGFLHLVGADQRIGDQSRFLRSNKIAKGDNEERGFAEVVEHVMAVQAAAKGHVKKLTKTGDFSALEKSDDLLLHESIGALLDVRMKGAFKSASDKNMRPADLDDMLKELPEADDAIRAVAVKGYTDYLKGIGKAVD